MDNNIVEKRRCTYGETIFYLTYHLIYLKEEIQIKKIVNDLNTTNKNVIRSIQKIRNILFNFGIYHIEIKYSKSNESYKAIINE